MLSLKNLSKKPLIQPTLSTVTLLLCHLRLRKPRRPTLHGPLWALQTKEYANAFTELNDPIINYLCFEAQVKARELRWRSDRHRLWLRWSFGTWYATNWVPRNRYRPSCNAYHRWITIFAMYCLPNNEVTLKLYFKNKIPLEFHRFIWQKSLVSQRLLLTLFRSQRFTDLILDALLASKTSKTIANHGWEDKASNCCSDRDNCGPPNTFSGTTAASRALIP